MEKGVKEIVDEFKEICTELKSRGWLDSDVLAAILLLALEIRKASKRL